MSDTTTPSPEAVAQHLAECFYRDDLLYQETAVQEIEEHFGGEYLYLNKNGNPAIHKRVLAAFRELTPDAVWSRSSFYWIKRDPDSSTGRSQD